jgi:hypothetical protein
MKNKLILTESEKSRISGLHRMAIANESKNTLNEADLKQIQQLLMQKLGPEILGPKKDDGKLGAFTLNAIYSALTQTQGTQPTGTQPTGTQPTGTQPTGTQPQSLNLVPGLIGIGILQDEAEGRTMVVNKVTPLNCGITEVEFKLGQNIVYGYYKPSDLNDVAIKNREISFKRLGDGVKATDACKQYESDQFGGAGLLKFGTKPNEKPIIE